jgi:hypothetical protein
MFVMGAPREDASRHDRVGYSQRANLSLSDLVDD